MVQNNSSIAQLIAHRGLSSIFPENTLLALQAAYECGARYVEFDVQFTADVVPVLLHDATLERTSGVSGNVNEMTLAQIQDLTAGEPARFGDRFKDVSITSFVEAVQFVNACPDLTCFIDVKDDGVDRLGADVVLEALLGQIKDTRASFVVTSAQHDLIRHAFQRGVQVALVIDDLNTTSEQFAIDVAVSHIFSHMHQVDAAGGVLQQAAWQWAIYGVETAEDADRMLAGGAHFIETRSFDVLQRHLFNARQPNAPDVKS